MARSAICCSCPERSGESNPGARAPAIGVVSRTRTGNPRVYNPLLKPIELSHTADAFRARSRNTPPQPGQRGAARRRKRRAALSPGETSKKHARKESNPHRPDLESGALPVELRACVPSRAVSARSASVNCTGWNRTSNRLLNREPHYPLCYGARSEMDSSVVTSRHGGEKLKNHG